MYNFIIFHHISSIQVWKHLQPTGMIWNAGSPRGEACNADALLCLDRVNSAGLKRCVVWNDAAMPIPRDWSRSRQIVLQVLDCVRCLSILSSCLVAISSLKPYKRLIYIYIILVYTYVVFYRALMEFFSSSLSLFWIVLLRSLLLLGLAFGFAAGSLAALAALIGGRLFSAPCLGD